MTRTTYGSTSIRLAQECCPRALDLDEAGTPRRADHFGVGTACHAVLDALQQARGHADDEVGTETAERVGHDAAAALVRGGWTHRGMPQAPLRPDDVQRGRELAMRWHRWHGTIAGAWSEMSASMPVDGSPVSYRTQLDLTWVEWDETEDDSESRMTVVTRDYKTAWSASRSDCDSSQMRAAALLAIDTAERVSGRRPDRVRIEIAAVRTLTVHVLEVWEDDPILADWRAQITATVRGLEAMPRPRPAIPSVRCGRCPYLHACSDGQRWLDGMQASDPHTIAARMIARRNAAKADEAMLRELLPEDAIDVDGWRVGMQEVRRRVPAPGSPRALAEAWQHGAGWSDDSVAGLIRAMAPGVKAYEAAAKAMAPDRTHKAVRDEMLARLTTPVIGAQWDVSRVRAADVDQASEDDGGETT